MLMQCIPSKLEEHSLYKNWAHCNKGRIQKFRKQGARRITSCVDIFYLLIKELSLQMWFQVKAVKEENQISGQSGRAEREGVKGTAPPYICPYSVVGKMGVNDQGYKVMMADSLGHSFDGISMVNKIKYLLYRQENIFFLQDHHGRER